MEKKFESVQKAIELNLALLEELMGLDYSLIEADEKDFLFSQLKKTVGRIASIIVKYDK